MKRLPVLLIGFGLIVLGFVSACTTPLTEVATLPADLADGRVLFSNKCGSCHPAGLAGLGPAIINKPLPKSLIRFQIRHGLGVMPAFDDTVFSDRQVKDIARYLAYLKRGSRR